MKESTKQKLLDIAEIIDSYRTVPRLLVAGYGYMLYETTHWFMQVVEPNNAQSMFISVLWGAAAAIFGFYARTGRIWDGQPQKLHTVDEKPL